MPFTRTCNAVCGSECPGRHDALRDVERPVPGAANVRYETESHHERVIITPNVRFIYLQQDLCNFLQHDERFEGFCEALEVNDQHSSDETWWSNSAPFH